MHEKLVAVPLALSMFLAVLIGGCAEKTVKNPWHDFTEPNKAPAEPIGSYEKGCLLGGVSMYPEGPGFQVMRPSRRRYYGHPSLVKFIDNLGAATAKKKLGVLLIGDLSQPRGGPTLSSHNSHQTGLDVDIWFEQGRSDEPLTLDDLENKSAVSMVTPDDLALNVAAVAPGSEPAWSSRKLKILGLAAAMPEVDRIFVDPLIKKEFCKLPARPEWLKKIRPWWSHYDHFHVRLKCPDGATRCVGQAPSTEFDCDASLDWWFSDEARKPSPKKETKAPVMPELPEACLKLLKE